MKRSVEFTLDSTFAQQCYEQLQLEIVQGILKPGEKLKVEPIKNRFGIGQSPVREALSRLAAFGLVEVEENKGFRVAQISEQDIRDTYAVFTEIETRALVWAIERGDDEWETNIVAQLYRLSTVELSASPVSSTLWLQRNYDFHIALISGCKSKTLLEIRRHLYMKFDRYCQMSYQLSNYSSHGNHKAHKELADAVLKRDIIRAKALLFEHINAPLEEIVKEFKQHNLF